MLLSRSLEANETGAQPWRSTDTRAFPPPSKISPCRNTRSVRRGVRSSAPKKSRPPAARAVPSWRCCWSFSDAGIRSWSPGWTAWRAASKTSRTLCTCSRHAASPSERPSSRSIPRVRRGKPFWTCWGCSPNLKPTSAGSANRKGLPPPRPVGCIADASRPLIPSRIIACAPRNSSARPRLRVRSRFGGPQCIARWPAVMASRKVIPVDSLVQLRQRLDRLPSKSPERAAQIAAVAQLYGVSSTTVYRALRALLKPHAAHRADRGTPRVLPRADLERYCELIAALKLRTTNKQGRHLSTQRAIELLEQYGVETAQGLLRAPPGVLHKSTINLYLGQWHLDHPRLTRQPPAVRFEAEQSNTCWQFDMSPSDLKHLETPDWIDPRKGEPTLMLFSVVDDRSGVSYMEYRCVYGEDAESALRFLFNAMAPKADSAFPFQGRPQLLYLDNGPVAKSRVFQTVLLALGVAWQTHVPAGKDGTRVTARAKGKVERPFRTVKEAHETLYHFHKPDTEAQANTWLLRYLLRYNDQQHRSQSHSRMADWLVLH